MFRLESETTNKALKEALGILPWASATPNKNKENTRHAAMTGNKFHLLRYSRGISPFDYLQKVNQ